MIKTFDGPPIYGSRVLNSALPPTGRKITEKSEKCWKILFWGGRVILALFCVTIPLWETVERYFSVILRYFGKLYFHQNPLPQVTWSLCVDWSQCHLVWPQQPKAVQVQPIFSWTMVTRTYKCVIVNSSLTNKVLSCHIMPYLKLVFMFFCLFRSFYVLFSTSGLWGSF